MAAGVQGYLRNIADIFPPGIHVTATEAGFALAVRLLRHLLMLVMLT